jgi:Glycosyl hydrolase 2 galactose-binding domain-like/Exo-beta-D-glucosaminidase Ig-fold domain/Glycosyl hydrolases family 2/NedA-like, galactose-binding domain
MKNSIRFECEHVETFSSRANLFRIVLTAIMVTVISVAAGFAQERAGQKFTLGVGVYPGDPSENFAPSMRLDNAHYRNLALLRPAYQSSAYDYNLTAQLITDGIVDTALPGWIVTATSFGILDKKERDWVLDRHEMSKITVDSSSAWLQVEMAGNYDVPAVDSVNISGTLLIDSLAAGGWNIVVTGSADGTKWDTLGSSNGRGLPGDTLSAFFRSWLPQNMRTFAYAFRLDSGVHYKYYRFEANSPNAESWSVGIFGLYHEGQFANVGGPYHFTSAWKSAGSGREWVYVDLGAVCSFDDVKLDWIRPALEGSIQVSDDATGWKDIAALSGSGGKREDIGLERKVKARYVRVLMTKPADPADGYILSELEVYGTGGPMPVQHAGAPFGKSGRMNLAGGSWRLQRSSLVFADGATLSRPGFDDVSWPIATVPGTILTSYLNDGAIPDPNFGDNQVLISDSYFYSDFWYRDVFTPPGSYEGKRMYINFDGINWKAEVYLNGRYLGRIDGAFIRGRFDVTGVMKPGETNVLAVRIIKNATPGFPTEQDRYNTDSNGGELGADNPTFHASVGWDWIPTIRGRNTGIWSDVYLSESGPVTIENPFVSTKLPLPDTATADLSVEVTLQNHSAESVSGILRGKIGSAAFEKSVTLASAESKTVTLDHSNAPSLRIHHPKLWWPNGYGEQNLYGVKLEFISGGTVSDSKSFETGVREMSYSEKGGPLTIRVNGRRLVARGGNWGFPESMLRYRAREYDVAVRYHKEMNFTMIRNWVGQTADDAFFDACDKYGIMVWQDFWLANPLDGPNPNDPEMFIRNAKDFIERLRNHPSVALFVGRNEGNPPRTIDSALVKMVAGLDPGSYYIPNSAFGPVSGGGPYRLMPQKFYFQYRATERLHSEEGAPAIVSYSSLKRMMPAKDLWPQSNMWGVHDFTLEGAQYGSSFNKTIEEHFGEVDSLREWLWLADWAEYRGYRAMFEAQSRNRMGLLLWMTHSSWPSLVWQTYDYYFDPTAAYFGSKEACQPLHIQWNAYTDSIEVVNYSVPNGSHLTATMELLNMDGAVKLKKSASLNCPEDSIVRLFAVTQPAGLTPVYFLRLELRRGGKVISRNIYWRELKGGDLKAVRELPKISVESKTDVSHRGARWYMTTSLYNNTKYPALLVKLKVVGRKDRREILPAIYSDNFITLMPGERRTVDTQVENADTRGEKPEVIVEGMNVR